MELVSQRMNCQKQLYKHVKSDIVSTPQLKIPRHGFHIPAMHFVGKNSLTEGDGPRVSVLRYESLQAK
jgi:hypothetical protein